MATNDQVHTIRGPNVMSHRTRIRDRLSFAFRPCLAMSTIAREPIKQALAAGLVFGFVPAPSHGRGQGFESPPLHHPILQTALEGCASRTVTARGRSGEFPSLRQRTAGHWRSIGGHDDESPDWISMMGNLRLLIEEYHGSRSHRT